MDVDPIRMAQNIHYRGFFRAAVAGALAAGFARASFTGRTAESKFRNGRQTLFPVCGGFRLLGLSAGVPLLVSPDVESCDSQRAALPGSTRCSPGVSGPLCSLVVVPDLPGLVRAVEKADNYRIGRGQDFFSFVECVAALQPVGNSSKLLAGDGSRVVDRRL